MSINKQLPTTKNNYNYKLLKMSIYIKGKWKEAYNSHGSKPKMGHSLWPNVSLRQLNHWFLHCFFFILISYFSYFPLLFFFFFCILLSELTLNFMITNSLIKLSRDLSVLTQSIKAQTNTFDYKFNFKVKLVQYEY